MDITAKSCAVLKVGGSLLETAPEMLSYLQEQLEFGFTTAFTVLIVPGGGIFANNVRNLHEKKGISDDAAHWMAILGMEQYGYYLADKSGIKTTDNTDKLPPGLSILLPYRLLRNKDPLPHSWDVTSDCIAAWVASLLDARLVKVTDVDGILIDGETVSAVDAIKLKEIGENCVDKMLPEILMRDRKNCMVINGKYPERVLAALEGKDVRGTLIKGNI